MTRFRRLFGGLEKKKKKKNRPSSSDMGLWLDPLTINDDNQGKIGSNSSKNKNKNKNKNNNNNNTVLRRSSASMPNAKYVPKSSDLSILIQSMKWDDVVQILDRFPEEASRSRSLPLFGDSGDESEALPLHLACANRAPVMVVKILVDVFPEGISVKDGRWGKLPLHFACLRRGGAEMIETLLRFYPEGAQVVDDDGRFPVHYACIYGSVEEVTAVFDAYPKAVRSKDNLGRSPFCAAMMSSNPAKSRIVAFLKDKVGRVDVPNNIDTLATLDGSDEISGLSFDQSQKSSVTNTRTYVKARIKTSSLASIEDKNENDLNISEHSGRRRMVKAASTSTTSGSSPPGLKDPPVRAMSESRIRTSLESHTVKDSMALTSDFLTQLLESHNKMNSSNTSSKSRFTRNASFAGLSVLSVDSTIERMQGATQSSSSDGGEGDFLDNSAKEDVETLVNRLVQKKLVLHRKQANVARCDEQIRGAEEEKQPPRRTTESISTRRRAVEEADRNVRSLEDELERLGSELERRKRLLREAQRSLEEEESDGRRREMLGLQEKRRASIASCEMVEREVENLHNRLNRIMFDRAGTTKTATSKRSTRSEEDAKTNDADDALTNGASVAERDDTDMKDRLIYLRKENSIMSVVSVET